MSFYKELSKVYDIVFPVEENTLKFLSKGLKANSNILDLACGTGAYSIELARKGHKVIGIDLDSEMIRLAQQKRDSLQVDFFTEDMRNSAVKFEHKKFHMIFSIGNSIVHLENKNQIKGLIEDSYNLLEDNGILSFQIINFDRIIKDKVEALPTINKEQQGVRFIRNYKHSVDNIYFETELEISKNGEIESYKNSVPLIPLQSKELLVMLVDSGFHKISLYGDFLENDFTDKAYGLIVRAYK